MKRIEIDMPKGIHQRTFQALEKTTEGLSNHWKVGLAVIALSLFSLVSTLGDTNAPPTNTPPVNTQSTNAPPSGSGIPAPGHTEAWVNLIEKHLFTVTGGVLLAVGLFLVLVGAIGMIPPIAKVVEKTKLGKSAPKRCIIVGSVLVIFGILFLVLQPFWSQVNTTGPTGSLTLFVLCIMSGITFLAGYLLHNRLRILVQHEEHLVGVVEDATRRVLKGFPEIFDRSLWLLDRALEEKREVWFVNCALNFGRVHAENPLIGKQYHELTKRQKVFFTKKTDPNSGAETEDGAVEEFRRKLSSMVEQMPILRILSITGETTKPDGTKSDATQAFLKSVTKPRGYETVKGHEAFDKMLTLIKGQKAEFKKKAVDYRKNFAPGSFQLYQTDTLPLQLLIARIPGRKGSNEVKWGCLVFMLGSDLIGKWEAAGYYTELDTIVGVYLSFAYGLMKNAREKFPDEAYEWYPPGRTQPQVSNSQDEEEPEKPDDES